MKTVQTKIVLLFFLAAIPGFARMATACVQEPGVFPLQGLVINNDTPVYSGPGSMHYATENLSAGESVEVWRFDPGGWCAIRPVSTSFCLIPNSAIERTGNGRGRVIEGGVQVWVGTRLGAVEQPLWQVSLVEDEEVEILGETTWPNPEGAPTIWLQIEPPAGEFRWIHRDAIRLPESNQLSSSVENRRSPNRNPDAMRSIINDSEVLQASTFPQQQREAEEEESAKENFLDDPFAGMKPVEIIRPARRESRNPQAGPGRQSDFVEASQIDSELSELSSAGGQSSARKSLADNSPGWRPARRPIQMVSAISPNPSSSPVNAGSWENEPVRSMDNGVSQSLFSEPVSSGPGMGIAATTAGVPTYGNEPLSSRLAALDIQLGAEIVKPAEYWNLDSIASAVIDAQSRASGQLERDQASRMIRKIDDLRKTRANLMASSSGVVSPFAIASSRQPVGAGRDTSVEIETSFDATGWLNELVQSNGLVDPSYVLQDDDGNITHHVVPSPGLNLNRYVRSRVGIIGQRGYNQRLERNHITADQVTVLEKPSRERTAFRGW